MRPPCVICDPTVVEVRGRRYQRLDGKNRPTPDPDKATGFVLKDKPVHGGGTEKP